MRQHQRALAKAQRELDRERTKLEQQEKKLIADIKKSAKSGQMVRVYGPLIPPWAFRPARTERLQGDGQGSRPHPAIRPEVLPDEDATTGRRFTDTNPSQQPADG